MTKRIVLFMALSLAVFVIYPVAAQGFSDFTNNSPGQPPSLVTILVTFMSAVTPLAIGLNRVLKNHADMIEDLRKELNQATQELRDERNEVEKLRQFADDKIRENEQLRKELSTLRPQFEQMQADVQQLQKLRDDLNAIKSLNESLTLEKTNIMKERDRFRDDNVLLTTTLANTQDENTSLKTQVGLLTEENNRLILLEQEYKGAKVVWDTERKALMETSKPEAGESTDAKPD